MISPKLWQNSATRTAAAFAALISGAVTIVFVLVYFEIRDELYERLYDRTDALHQTFISIYQSSGETDLEQVISDLATTPHADSAIYLLVDADGRFLAGNIESYPTFPGWRFVKPEDLHEDRFEHAERFLSSWSQLANGDWLLVGLSDDSVEETREALFGGIALGVVATVLITSLGAFWLARRNQRRIHALGLALEDFAQGNLDRRIDLVGADDDLDQVASRVNSMLDGIERLVESLRQISADIAHELKTPIGRLRQRLDLARAEADSIEEFREAHANATEQIDQIVATFEALLRIAQIEAGTKRTQFATVSLNEIVSNVVEIYEPVAIDAGHKLVSDVPSIACHIQGDRRLLTQMFANLIENAIRHCPSDAKIEVGLARERRFATVQVSDDGPGIPDDEREKVLRRLYRLEKSRSTEGTGLGLSLVKAIADLHDAELDLSDNRPGLRVRLSFPLTD